MQHQQVKKFEQMHESGSNHNSTKHAHSERLNVQCTGVRLYLQRQPVEEEEEELQTKLKVGAPNDKYEQEADRVADQVMRMPDSTAQRQTVEEEPIQTRRIANTITPLIQRQTEPEEEEVAVPEREESDQQAPEESAPILESAPTRDADELG